jgi:hypothetical protein
MMNDDLLPSALGYAGRGWPVLPVRANSKEPLTPRGVKDASTDPERIRAWWKRWPDANIGIACGHPGPQVLDIDRPAIARAHLQHFDFGEVPVVATARGRHLYFHGSARGTVTFDYGELRGTGSYVIAPPSAHATGKLYTWLLSPNGSLPQVPADLIGARQPAGAGEHVAPQGLVAHGERHGYLKDMAVRALRAGVTDAETIEGILASIYEHKCEKRPPAKDGYFRKIAEWAARTDIATRERERASSDDDGGGKPERATPGNNATLPQHRAFLRTAGGWGPDVDVQEVRRGGTNPTDELKITLTNGLAIRFSRQENITTRGHWQRTIILSTSGMANPPALKDHELVTVLRSLCILADTPPPDDREEAALNDTVRDYLSSCEPLHGYDLTDTAAIFAAVTACRARQPYDPRRGVGAPVLLVCAATGYRYIRAGELADYIHASSLDLIHAQIPGRMRDIGFGHVTLNGREGPLPGGGRRTKTHTVVYQLPPVPPAAPVSSRPRAREEGLKNEVLQEPKTTRARVLPGAGGGTGAACTKCDHAEWSHPNSSGCTQPGCPCPHYTPDTA